MNKVGASGEPTQCCPGILLWTLLTLLALGTSEGRGEAMFGAWKKEVAT